MLTSLLISQGKAFSKLSKALNLGNGSTWPGHIAINVHKSFIKNVLKRNPQLKIIFVVGTNGKTTTTSLIRHIIEQDGRTIIQNVSGANLLNGIASALISNATRSGVINADFAIFEIDENALPLAAKQITPDTIVILNLFRDQLDRYGEVNTIALKWKETLEKLPASTKLILNSNDPLVAFIGWKAKQSVKYFGIEEKGEEQAKIDHLSDSSYCPNCKHKLQYKKVYFSHMGEWSCKHCEFSQPRSSVTSSLCYPLSGLYNKYNVHAAILTAKEEGLSDKTIQTALQTFKPVFGRQEAVEREGKRILVTLVKNPTGFSQTLKDLMDQKANTFVFVLNDNPADGTDISWIWDIDFRSVLNQETTLIASGTRAHEMALRLKYEGITSYFIEPDVNNAIEKAIRIGIGEKISILPTYTAMLDVRKILTGKKIL